MNEKKTFTLATPEELEAMASRPEGNAAPLLEPRPLDLPPDGQAGTAGRSAEGSSQPWPERTQGGAPDGTPDGDAEDEGSDGGPPGGLIGGPYGGPFNPPEGPILMGNPKGSRYTGWNDKNHLAGYIRGTPRSGRWIVLVLLVLCSSVGTLIYLLISHKL